MVVETLGGLGGGSSHREEHWTASGPPIGNSPRPSHSTPFSAAGHQSVEGQRHSLDPPPPHSISGGGRANLTFQFYVPFITT